MKNFKKIVIILIILAVLAVLTTVVIYSLPKPISTIPGWQTYTDSVNNFEFQYPATFSGAVWRAENWPPSVKVLAGTENPLSGCGDTISNAGQNQMKEDKIINNWQFVLYTGTDVGAGQLYTDYCYILSQNTKYYVFDFLIHSTNGCGFNSCGPYCGTDKETACKNFNGQTEIEQPIGQIMSTLNFSQ